MEQPYPTRPFQMEWTDGIKLMGLGYWFLNTSDLSSFGNLSGLKYIKINKLLSSTHLNYGVKLQDCKIARLQFCNLLLFSLHHRHHWQKAQPITELRRLRNSFHPVSCLKIDLKLIRLSQRPNAHFFKISKYHFPVFSISSFPHFPTFSLFSSSHFLISSYCIRDRK